MSQGRRGSEVQRRPKLGARTRNHRAGRSWRVNSRTDWCSGEFGSRLSRSHTKTVLAGQGGESNNLSVFFGDGEQHLDVGITMLHEGEHTASDMLTKGVMDGRSRVRLPRSDRYRKRRSLQLRLSAGEYDAPQRGGPPRMPFPGWRSTRQRCRRGTRHHRPSRPPPPVLPDVPAACVATRRCT